MPTPALLIPGIGASPRPFNYSFGARNRPYDPFLVPAPALLIGPCRHRKKPVFATVFRLFRTAKKARIDILSKDNIEHGRPALGRRPHSVEPGPLLLPWTHTLPDDHPEKSIKKARYLGERGNVSQVTGDGAIRNYSHIIIALFHDNFNI